MGSPVKLPLLPLHARGRRGNPTGSPIKWRRRSGGVVAVCGVLEMRQFGRRQRKGALAGDGEGGVAGGLVLDDVDALDPGVGRPVPDPVEHALNVVLRSFEERLDGAVRPVTNPAADPGLLSLPAATVPEEHALDESVHNDTTADHLTVVPP
jgi:hypothetical protein